MADSDDVKQHRDALAMAGSRGAQSNRRQAEGPRSDSHPRFVTLHFPPSSCTQRSRQYTHACLGWCLRGLSSRHGEPGKLRPSFDLNVIRTRSFGPSAAGTTTQHTPLIILQCQPTLAAREGASDQARTLAPFPRHPRPSTPRRQSTDPATRMDSLVHRVGGLPFGSLVSVSSQRIYSKDEARPPQRPPPAHSDLAVLTASIGLQRPQETLYSSSGARRVSASSVQATARDNVKGRDLVLQTSLPACACRAGTRREGGYEALHRTSRATADSARSGEPHPTASDVNSALAALQALLQQHVKMGLPVPPLPFTTSSVVPPPPPATPGPPQPLPFSE